MVAGRAHRILLVVTGGIAAYKCLELIRRGRDRGLDFTCVVTGAASQFVTPLSFAAISGNQVYEDLFSLNDEAEMGHIRLSRAADLVVVAPATADIMAKMASGIANDLASTVLLATDKPVLAAPAMNPEMWSHPATRRNAQQLHADGIHFIGPEPGDMACGETGAGRMSEPAAILDAIEKLCAPEQPLSGTRALVTGGPTHEPIDPVRFIGNRSSGRQSYAIARALSLAGSDVTLVSGPVNLPDPAGVNVVRIESARDMANAVEASLPADIAVCAAAVADWRPADAFDQKIKKEAGGEEPVIRLVENPDILASLAGHTSMRPRLVVGFAAETHELLAHAQAKLTRKGCDWILANDVGAGSDVFGGDDNQITLIDQNRIDKWPSMTKEEVASRLVSRIVEAFST